MVANRGEIAIRIFRAATELGLGTVSVHTHEDRFALHRFKSDESYLIGPEGGGEPVKSYLNISQIVAVARDHGVDAIHPGYGFLAENADFARACEEHGVIFVGPTPHQLDLFGDKTAARRAARDAGIPILPGTNRALKNLQEVRDAAKKIGYPVIIKASFGGGGRGMRVVRTAAELAGKLEEARREAGAAFGKSDVFLERFITRAKHIEVQLLGDSDGRLVHLWERDCSVQRRHQKVVEVAPSLCLSADVRLAICESAVRLCKPLKYRSAGTVEFLYDLDEEKFYFIEVNPRIQVEHTVTEEVTGIDLVKSQILIADGLKLTDPELHVPPQNEIETRGYAMQCRITTEDPANRFIPDYGRLTTYRSPAGFGVRLDGGSAYGGAVITPYYDSLLVKVTTRGATLTESVRRMDRALREFRVRGVKTNIPFLTNLIGHPTFTSGQATTAFIDETPDLFRFRVPRDRATKLLSYLGDVIVNGRPDVKKKIDRKRRFAAPIVPAHPKGTPPPTGLRQSLLDLGPEKFCQKIRADRKLLFTDTTMRDAHQSILATRVRTYDLLAIADATAHLVPNLFSLEMWGGATFDTAMRFLQEDPWDRLIELRKRIPNIPFQMLLRASNAVGYTNYPDNVVREFIKLSARHGIDIFRIFDSLNWTANMKVAMETVREHTNAVCEAAICYTGDILDPGRPKYSLKYYVSMARELKKMGAHILAIKDMAGLCKPYAALALFKALRDEIDLPIHYHTHDTSGVTAASVLRAADAGVDIVDAALASMSGSTSQPCLNSLAAAIRHTPRDSGLDGVSLDQLSDYWKSVREFYYPFEEGLKSPTSDVYRHEMPGGQYTNLLQQAKSLGLESRWPEVCDAYAAANRLFGDIVKVTPSSKVVGDMALFMVTNHLTVDDVLSSQKPLSFPRSVVEMMQGLLGRPQEGWPKKIQEIVLKSARAKAIRGRPGASLKKVNLDTSRRDLAAKIGRDPTGEELLSFLLYSQVFLDYDKHNRQYDNVGVIPTPQFFYGLQPGEEISIDIEEGKRLILKFLTTGEPHEDGTRTVFFELNGQPREVNVVDHSLEGKLHKHPKANPDNPDHIAAPMPGKVSNVVAAKGQAVKSGDPILSIEAMKMETAIYCPRDAKVADILVQSGMHIEAGDLLMVLEAG